MNLPLDFINIVEPNGRMCHFSVHGNQTKDNQNKMMRVSGGLEHGTMFVPASIDDAFKMITWLEKWIAENQFVKEFAMVNDAHAKKIEISKKSGNRKRIPCKVI